MSANTDRFDVNGTIIDLTQTPRSDLDVLARSNARPATNVLPGIPIKRMAPRVISTPRGNDLFFSLSHQLATIDVQELTVLPSGVLVQMYLSLLAQLDKQNQRQGFSSRPRGWRLRQNTSTASERHNHKWAKRVGMFNHDPSWAEVFENIKANREKLKNESDFSD